MDILAHLRERRKRQEDPRTESLLRSIATVLINSIGGSSICALKVSRSCQKNVAQLPHRDEHQRHCIVCSVLCNRNCIARCDPVSNDSPSSVEPDCVTAEVNIFEGAEHVSKRQERNETSAGRRAQKCSVVVFTASETSLHCRVSDQNRLSKNASSRTPQQAPPPTRIRSRLRDHPELDLTTESKSSPNAHKSGSVFEPCTCKIHTCRWW